MMETMMGSEEHLTKTYDKLQEHKAIEAIKPELNIEEEEISLNEFKKLTEAKQN